MAIWRNFFKFFTNVFFDIFNEKIWLFRKESLAWFLLVTSAGQPIRIMNFELSLFTVVPQTLKSFFLWKTSLLCFLFHMRWQELPASKHNSKDMTIANCDSSIRQTDTTSVLEDHHYNVTSPLGSKRMTLEMKMSGGVLSMHPVTHKLKMRASLGRESHLTQKCCHDNWLLRQSHPSQTKERLKISL